MKRITSLIIGAVFAGLVIYDVYAISQGGTESSISSVIINFSYKMPIFTFTLGVVCGHLFWRMKSNNDTKEIDGGK